MWTEGWQRNRVKTKTIKMWIWTSKAGRRFRYNSAHEPDLINESETEKVSRSSAETPRVQQMNIFSLTNDVSLGWSFAPRHIGGWSFLVPCVEIFLPAAVLSGLFHCQCARCQRLNPIPRAPANIFITSNCPVSEPNCLLVEQRDRCSRSSGTPNYSQQFKRRWGENNWCYNILKHFKRVLKEREFLQPFLRHSPDYVEKWGSSSHLRTQKWIKQTLRRKVEILSSRGR